MAKSKIKIFSAEVQQTPRLITDIDDVYQETLHLYADLLSTSQVSILSDHEIATIDKERKIRSKEGLHIILFSGIWELFSKPFKAAIGNYLQAFCTFLSIYTI